jgi:hypothetical protein
MNNSEAILANSKNKNIQNIKYYNNIIIKKKNSFTFESCIIRSHTSYN